MSVRKYVGLRDSVDRLIMHVDPRISPFRFIEVDGVFVQHVRALRVLDVSRTYAFDH